MPGFKVSTSDKKDEEPARWNGRFHYYRFLLIVMCGLSTGFMFVVRINFTVSIMSMVNHTHVHMMNNNGSIGLDEFMYEDYKEIGEFPWNHEIQQTILSSYMIFYTLPQVVTTRIGIKFGPRASIAIGLMTCAISSGLTPIFAYWDWKWVVLLRWINGFGASHIVPINLYMLERWIPASERSKSLIIMQFVSNIFAVAAPLVSGLLSSIHWRWSFYIPSVLSALYSLVWLSFVTNEITENRFVSKKELDFIKSEKAKNILRCTGKESAEFKWYGMFFMKPFYFFTIVWIFFCDYAGGLMIFLAPNYLHETLKITIEENGFYNFIIQAGCLVSMIYPQFIIILLKRTFDFSLTNARKVTLSLCNVLATIPLLYIAYFHDNQVLSFCLSRLFHATNDIIITSTLIDKFGPVGLSSIVYSMMNTFGCLSIFVFCWAVGIYLDYEGATLASWSSLFRILAGWNLVHILMYDFFLDSEPLEHKEIGEETDTEVAKDSKMPKPDLIRQFSQYSQGSLTFRYVS